MCHPFKILRSSIDWAYFLLKWLINKGI
jgi:hypothetical protein